VAGMFRGRMLKEFHPNNELYLSNSNHSSSTVSSKKGQISLINISQNYNLFSMKTSKL